MNCHGMIVSQPTGAQLGTFHVEHGTCSMTATPLYHGSMTTTQITAEQATELMNFDIRCVRQGIEAGASTIRSNAQALTDIAADSDADPFLIAHYAEVIAKDAAYLASIANYAKGIAAARVRLNGEG